MVYYVVSMEIKHVLFVLHLKLPFLSELINFLKHLY